MYSILTSNLNVQYIDIKFKYAVYWHQI